MALSKSERQKIISDLKDEIEKKLNVVIRIEGTPTGRDGTLLYASINKKGVRGLEVISCANGDIFMGISVNDDKSSALVKEIMKTGGYNMEKDQKNPRYAFNVDDVEKFGEAYDYLRTHSELND